ncbi:Protein fluG [Porphyridium purpureum]|uniref:Protein fluG n=1 Tax=Porphyridium purpureum TaxID=35688 RepID=A0A5J4Z7K8_PORPP|nr:Protein fluG [Porphyridium purpureum]|eukprot:POR5788..scf295_1
MQRFTIYEDVFIRVCWTDYSGLQRARVVSARQLLQSMPARATIMNNGIRLYEQKDYDAVDGLSSVGKYGIGITEACLVLMPTADCFPKNCALGSTREVRIFPDWKKLKAFELNVPLPFLGQSKEQSFCYVPSFLRQNDGSDWPFCPRTILHKTLNKFREQTGGLEVMIGMEYEFVLVDAQTKAPIAGDQTYSSLLKYDRIAPFLERLERVLHSVGVHTEQIHGESAPGQFELPVRFKAASDTADDVGLVRQIIHVLAQLYGMEASFCPKLKSSAPGSGFHCHFTGIFHRLPEIMLITSASPLSFQRVQPGTWTGAYMVWGYENRECPLRVLRLGQNFELKVMDSSANTHLAFAAIVAAGLQGILNREVLPEATDGDPHQIYISQVKAQKASKGASGEPSEPPPVLVKRLPQTLDELLAGAGGFPCLSQAFGQEVVDTIVATRTMENQMARESVMKHSSDWESLFDAYRFRY